MTIAIIDLGVGNYGSVALALKKLNVSALITSDPEIISKAEKIILPGVGAFDTVIAAIDRLNLRETLIKIAHIGKQPILGICVGMQVLTHKSSEGELPGLGIIPGHCKRFNKTTVKIPHIGWNQLAIANPCPLFNNLIFESQFYFVHSYYVVPDNAAHITTTTEYEVSFASAIHLNNVFGVQFHPEKSHRYGLTFLKNFVEM